MRITGNGQRNSLEVERGQSIAIVLSQQVASVAPWTIDVYVRTSEGRSHLGRVVTNPPTAIGGRSPDHPARIVAFAGVGGALSWDLEFSTPGADIAEAWAVGSEQLAFSGIVQPITTASGLPGGSCEMRAVDVTAPILGDMFPGVAGLGFGYDATAALWRAIAVNGAGQILVGPVTLTAPTVDTTIAAPTDPGGLYLGVAGEIYAWNPTTGLWTKAEARDMNVDPIAGGVLPAVGAELMVYDAAGWHKLRGLTTGEPVVSRIDGSAVGTYLGAITMASPNAPGVLHSVGAGGTISGLAKYENITAIGELLGAVGGPTIVRVQDDVFGTVDFWDWLAFPSVPLATLAPEAIFSTHAALTGVPNKIGKNDQPRLVAGSVRGGAWGDTARISCEAGAATTAGAIQKVHFLGHKLR